MSPAGSIRSIVVGTDGSDAAAFAVREVADLAGKLGAKVHLVSAFEPASGVKVSGAGSDPERAEWSVGPTVGVDSLLERAAGTLRAHGVQVETYARKGDAAGAIIDVAEEQKAHLIVIGSKGMTSARRFLLGSVPDKVSHHAPCSVLIIRTS
jgi:nucleotide-binding universal stress UspA family protein